MALLQSPLIYSNRTHTGEKAGVLVTVGVNVWVGVGIFVAVLVGLGVLV